MFPAMNGPLFKLKIITPSKVFEREVTHIRLRDESGFFGILAGHADFITALPPSLGYYSDPHGRETFIAVNEGILSVKDGLVTLSAREVFESGDAGQLSELIKKEAMGRSKTEAGLSGMLKGMERAFIEKTVRFERGV